MSVKRVPLLVLDIDGTVRKGYDELGWFVNGPKDVEVFPEAVKQMSKWKIEREGRIIGVSNQGGIALGHVSVSDVTLAMMETYKQTNELFDKISFCQHHPEAVDPEWAKCWCRKPSPGLLIETALEVARDHDEMYPPHMGLMVGDRFEDEQCAFFAGFDFMNAKEWRAGGE